MKKASLPIRGFPCRTGLATVLGWGTEEGEAGSTGGAGQGAAVLPARSIPGLPCHLWVGLGTLLDVSLSRALFAF